MGALVSRLFAATHDALSVESEAAVLGAVRRELLRSASGRVVEVGAGTGENLGHYAALAAEAAAASGDAGDGDKAATAATTAGGCGLGGAPPAPYTRLVLVEPNPHMRARLHARVDGLRDRRLAAGVEVVDAALPALPFADASFDTVVLFLVLCSVPDVPAAVAEARRLLAPGGRVLLVEHLAAKQPAIAARQARWEWLWRILFDGCRLCRETLDMVAAGGFDVGGVAERSWRLNAFDDLWLARLGVGIVTMRGDGGEGGTEGVMAAA